MTTVVIQEGGIKIKNVNPKEKEFLYLQESAIRSVLTDLFTFGIVFSGFFLNRIYFGNKWYLDIFIMFCLFVSAFHNASGRTKIFHNKKDLKKYVDSL